MRLINIYKSWCVCSLSIPLTIQGNLNDLFENECIYLGDALDEGIMAIHVIT